VRVAQALARATDEAVACCAVAHELCQLAGTSAVAIYLVGGVTEGELRLAAHAGDGSRETWSGRLALPRRAARAGRPTPATRADSHQLASVGVASRSVVAIPLACSDERLGVLVVAGEDVLPPEQTVITTVADLTSSTLSALRRLAESAEEARRDALTGLPNKRAFRELLSSTLDAGQATGSSLSLVAFDIDDFKRINDTQGHPAGDRVLRQVARVTLRALRAGEEAFRVGGEEFAIVVPESLDIAVGVANESGGHSPMRRATCSQRSPLALQRYAWAVEVSTSSLGRQTRRSMRPSAAEKIVSLRLGMSLSSRGSSEAANGPRAVCTRLRCSNLRTSPTPGFLPIRHRRIAMHLWGVATRSRRPPEAREQLFLVSLVVDSCIRPTGLRRSRERARPHSRAY